MSKRQITIKPTCMREILAFPAGRVAVLWEKINQLVSDPIPDGKVKKKLKNVEDVFRLRVGDHRVFYRFGADWVCLLGVRPRREDTYVNIPQEGGPPSVPAGEEDLDALVEAKPKEFRFAPTDNEQQLPFALTRSWLNDHGVPPAAQPALARCRTEEELLAADVAPEVLARVVDAIFPPSIQRVAQQPDLLVPSADHLVQYRASNGLLSFLLALDEDQRKLTRWALNGPTMVTGGAGTGKSTVALYRVKEVLERAGASGHERVLFTTYTRALVAVTRQLLAQLLTKEQLACVDVATFDQVARDIVASARKLRPFESDRETRQRLRALRTTYAPVTGSAFEDRLRLRALARLSDDYLLEEIEWIITGRGLTTLEAYLEAPRPGRGVAFPARLRTVVWELAQALDRGATGERFVALRNEARAIVTGGGWRGHWDHVFVDEAQDLSPSALALLADVCARPEGLFVVADTKQSIYARSYSWTSAHPRLQFRGRTAALKRNYRSTREIEQAAFSVLVAEDGEKLEASASVHEGPLPVLVREVGPGADVDWIVRFVRQMARHLHLRPDAAAVLVPTTDLGESVARELTAAGVPARFFTGGTIDLEADCVKVLTLHAAKGLEFPIVVVAGFEPGTYPVAKDFDDVELFAERMRHERRLLYVGLTRAMRGLMLLVPIGCQHPALVELDASRWHVEAGG